MKNKIIYQCFPSKNPIQTSHQIRNLIQDIDVEILLDLEDSIQNIINPELNSELKSIARQDLAELLYLLPQNKKYHVRINSISTETSKDIALLHELKDRIKSVFVPKIENKENLLHYVKLLEQISSNISIIIESTRGVRNIIEILDTDTEINIDYVFFGNYDYHLDNNTYPIVEQNSQEYWDIVLPLSKTIENLGYSFGNSPYANLRDYHTLIESIKNLDYNCKRKFALMSIHNIQTKVISDFLNGVNINSHFKQTKVAKHIIEKKIPNEIFSYTNQGKIITPQEYLLSKRNNNG